MKIEFNLKQNTPKFDLDKWLSENEPVLHELQLKKVERLYQHYLELKDDFREFLNSTENIVDSQGTTLSASENIFAILGIVMVSASCMFMQYRSVYENTRFDKAAFIFRLISASDSL